MILSTMLFEVANLNMSSNVAANIPLVSNHQLPTQLLMLDKVCGTLVQCGALRVQYINELGSRSNGMLAHFSNQNSSGEGRQATSQVEAQMLMRYMVQLELETNGFQCSVVAKLPTTSYPRSVLTHTTQRLVCLHTPVKLA